MCTSLCLCARVCVCGNSCCFGFKWAGLRALKQQISKHSTRPFYISMCTQTAVRSALRMRATSPRLPPLIKRVSHLARPLHGLVPRPPLHGSPAGVAQRLLPGPHGRSLLQESGVSVRVEALSVGGSTGLRGRRAALPPPGLEARGAGPLAGGRPGLQRSESRWISPTLCRAVSLLPGVHE